MARQPYLVNTTEKKIEVYGSFGGGMVSQAHPEKLRDNESVLMENVDIRELDVIRARGAYAQTNKPSTAIVGKTQGYFQYIGANGVITEIAAIAGRLYKVIGNTYTAIGITGLGVFQTTRQIEATQYRDKMYIATGNGLVKYDGTTASLVTAYAPNPLEALYIGTNGYAANPDAYLSDMTGAANAILGVVPDKRYGVINTWVTFSAFVETIQGTTVELQFETKRSDEIDYKIMRVWGTGKTFTTQFPTKADYQVRVSLRVQGQTTVLSQYVLPRYRVNTVPDENPEPSINFENLKTCNRIFVHYDRLFLYGDTTNPDFLYSSHLNKFDYFPRTNIMKVVDPLRGNLTSVERYKDFLVCFTDGSIQGIKGKNPQEFTMFPIHTSLGTKFGYSTQIIQNYILFVGNDNAMYILKSFNYASDDKMNVERIDDKVKDSLVALLKTTTNVISCSYDDQYYLYIENTNNSYIYRFYHNKGTWVRDNVGALKFSSMKNFGNTLHLADVNGGILYKLTYDTFKDGTNSTYAIRIMSKHFDYGVPHHRKKLKQYQLLAKLSPVTTINVKLYVDNTLLSDTNLSYDPNQDSEAHKLKVMASGRFRYAKTDLTIEVNEFVELIGFAFIFKLNTPK